MHASLEAYTDTVGMLPLDVSTPVSGNKIVSLVFLEWAYWLLLPAPHHFPYFAYLKKLILRTLLFLPWQNRMVPSEKEILDFQSFSCTGASSQSCF